MSTTTKKSELSTSLNRVVEATLSTDPGFIFLSPDDIRNLLAEYPGSIQVDIAHRDKKGNVAARATSQGISAAYGGDSAEHSEEHVAPVTRTRFKLDDNIPIPVPRRGIQAEPRYPFNLLNVGQSFMVPATPERPNPAKGLASTVSSANKRMARLNPPKKFIIRPVDENGVKGARIWRVE